MRQGRLGVVYVSSGADGDLIVKVKGGTPDDQFGYSVHSSSDLNGDGFKDLIIGALNEDQGGSTSSSAPSSQAAP